MKKFLTVLLGRHNEVPESFAVFRRHWCIAVILALGTMVVLSYKVHGVPILDDVVQHFMWARDCLEGIRCHFSGNDFNDLKIEDGLRRRWLMGALPIHFLTAYQWLGISIRQLHCIVIGFLGAQTALVYLFTIRMIGRRFALASALFSLYLVLGWSLFPNLYNDFPQLVFHPDFHGFSCFVRPSQSARYRWLALLALFCAGEGHIINYFLIVIFCTYLAVYARRPFRSIYISLSVLALLVSFYSHEGYYINVQNLIFFKTRAFPLLSGRRFSGFWSGCRSRQDCGVSTIFKGIAGPFRVDF